MEDMSYCVSIDKMQEMLDLYTLCKEYYTKSEECVGDMRTFVAPLFEYRDALEHIMRFMKFGFKDEEQIKSAIGHLKRAFFDISDYICIRVREQIALELKPYSKRKIRSCWNEYKKYCEDIYNYSEELAKIRAQRGWGNCETPEIYYEDDIDKYKNIVDKFLSVHKIFFTDINPKLKR